MRENSTKKKVLKKKYGKIREKSKGKSHVSSGQGLFRSSMRTVSLPVDPPQMRLEPYPYTTGITVLTVISKIVETIIKARIQNQVLEIQSRTG